MGGGAGRQQPGPDALIGAEAPAEQQQVEHGVVDRVNELDPGAAVVGPADAGFDRRQAGQGDPDPVADLLRIVEGQAMANAYPNHPAVARMRSAVDAARKARDLNDWTAVGSENMKFHAAIVDLADSQRLNGFYAQIAAELRLSFGLLKEPELLHGPYVEMNAAILEKLNAGDPKGAAAALEIYLLQSERTVLAAFSRI